MVVGYGAPSAMAAPLPEAWLPSESNKGVSERLLAL